MISGSHQHLQLLPMLIYVFGSYITMSATGTLHIAADVFQELALCYDIPVAFINSVLDYGGEPRYTAFGSRPPRAEKIQGILDRPRRVRERQNTNET